MKKEGILFNDCGVQVDDISSYSWDNKQKSLDKTDIAHFFVQYEQLLLGRIALKMLCNICIIFYFGGSKSETPPWLYECATHRSENFSTN